MAEHKARGHGNGAGEPPWLVGMVWALGIAFAVVLALVAWPLAVVLLPVLIAWQSWRIAKRRA